MDPSRPPTRSTLAFVAHARLAVSAMARDDALHACVGRSAEWVPAARTIRVDQAARLPVVADAPFEAVLLGAARGVEVGAPTPTGVVLAGQQLVVEVGASEAIRRAEVRVEVVEALVEVAIAAEFAVALRRADRVLRRAAAEQACRQDRTEEPSCAHRHRLQLVVESPATTSR